MQKDELKRERYRVLELFCGIGGMRYALEEVGVAFDIIAAIDVNPVVNNIYQHNFGNQEHFQRNIVSLTAEEIEKMNLDVITMSPPCQPFTRVGLRKDIADARSSPLLHILIILKKLLKKPLYILVENVQGFENSKARLALVETLEKCGYRFQEFLLSPKDLGIPNSRLRYYIIAKLKERQFPFSESNQLLYKIPKVKNQRTFACPNHHHIETEDNAHCPLKHFLEENASEEYLLPGNILLKYWSVFDIVNEHSYSSCCFTKAYYRYALGTGSVLSSLPESKASTVFELVSQCEDKIQKLDLLKQLELRYFTPREIANILCFPCNFDFPQNVELKQMYKSLGNSLNVFVVSCLMHLMFQNGSD